MSKLFDQVPSVDFVNVVDTDYGDFVDARGMMQMVDGRLHLLAKCRDGKWREYKSTRIVAVEDDWYGTLYTTRTGKKWTFS